MDEWKPIKTTISFAKFWGSFHFLVRVSYYKSPTLLTCCVNHISDELWDMNLTSRNGIESGFYPVREGEPDCSYYIRTGLCRFGNSCRFNHPTNRKLVSLYTI